MIATVLALTVGPFVGIAISMVAKGVKERRTHRLPTSYLTPDQEALTGYLTAEDIKTLRSM